MNRLHIQLVYHMFCVFMDENIIAPEDLERPNAPKFPAFTTNYTLSADKTIGAAQGLHKQFLTGQLIWVSIVRLCGSDGWAPS